MTRIHIRIRHKLEILESYKEQTKTKGMNQKIVKDLEECVNLSLENSIVKNKANIEDDRLRLLKKQISKAINRDLQKYKHERS